MNIVPPPTADQLSERESAPSTALLQSAKGEDPLMRVVFHVDQGDRFDLAQANISNMAAYYEQENIPHQIELVLNGEAVKLARKGEKQQSDLNRLLRLPVTIAVCQNALNNNRIEPGELVAGVSVVPAGVVEIVQKQREGFAYINP